MTFLERYQHEATWYGRVIIIEIFHLTMTQRSKNWTIAKTASEFNLSVSLVSENLKIAEAMHQDSTIINCGSRVKALRQISCDADKKSAIKTQSSSSIGPDRLLSSVTNTLKK